MQIEKRTYKGCSHIYALKIAIKFSRYRDLSNKISLSDLNKIIEEIMEVDYSSHLREILVKQDVS
jgi:predicted nucleic acid-binding Zn finger protein